MESWGRKNGSMGWAFMPARESFAQYRGLWDALNKTQGNHILLDSSFVDPLIRYFGGARTLLGISKDPQKPAMVLVEKSGKGFWQTFQPSQGPIGLILLGYRDGVVEGIREMMRCLPGYAMGFAVLQQDPDFTVFKNMNHCQQIEVLEYIQTARLSLQGTFEEYWQSRSRNLRHNLDRQRRLLAKQGMQLELVITRELDRIAACLEEYGRLEGTGWKAKQGTAVIVDNSQGAFYRKMLESFCAQGEGVIYQLLLDGKTIASDLCLERDGMLIVLKTAYDESVQGLSPALLMRQEIMRRLFSEGKIRVVEFYGRRLDWHTKWTKEIRTMYHINFFRHMLAIKARRVLKTLTARSTDLKPEEQ